MIRNIHTYIVFTFYYFLMSKKIFKNPEKKLEQHNSTITHNFQLASQLLLGEVNATTMEAIEMPFTCRKTAENPHCIFKE